MDKEIRRIEKDVKKISSMHKKKHNERKMQKDISKVGRELKSLERADIKRDKIVEKAKKMQRKK